MTSSPRIYCGLEADCCAVVHTSVNTALWSIFTAAFRSYISILHLLNPSFPCIRVQRKWADRGWACFMLQLRWSHNDLEIISLIIPHVNLRPAPLWVSSEHLRCFSLTDETQQADAECRLCSSAQDVLVVQSFHMRSKPGNHINPGNWGHNKLKSERTTLESSPGLKQV